MQPARRIPRRRRRGPATSAGGGLLAVAMVAVLLGLAGGGCGGGSETGGKPLAAGGSFGSLEGRIFDARTGAGIADALVQLEKGTQLGGVRSGLDGGFRFPELQPGVYQLIASSPMHQTLRQGVSVGGGSAERRDLRLQPVVVQGAVEVQVVDAVSLTPLAGVDVLSLETGRRLLTNVAGKALFGQLAAGTARFQLTLAGYQVATVSATVNAGEVSTPAFPLLRLSGTIQGTVTQTPVVGPVPGALVSLPGLSISSVTDAAGMYRLDDVPAGTFVDVIFSEPSLAPVLVTTGVAVGRVTNLDVVLVAGFGQVQGTVRRLGGSPLAGAVVSIPEHVLTTVTDVLGQYAFPRVPADPTVSIGAFAAGHAPTSVLFFVPPNGFVTQDLDLIPTLGSVSGTVRQTNGLVPVANALISLPTVGVTTFSDATGTYNLTGLPSQVLPVMVQATGLSDLTTAIEVLPGVTVLQDLIMETLPPLVGTGVLTGQVTNASGGAGIPNAVLSLPTLSRSTFTNSSGFYSLTAVPETPSLAVIVNAAGFTDATTSVPIVASTINVANIQLSGS